ncbi:MAG: phosphoesterase, partial [Bacteroidetes bacterium]
MNRRNFIAKTIGSFAAIGAGTALYAWQIEPRWLEIVQVDMPIKNLPPSLVGKTLMQISDLHVGKRFNPSFLIKSLQKAAALKPDFVAYTGDYITLTNNEVDYQALEQVLTNAVKGTLGTVGILGNHDYGTAWQQDDVADNVTERLTRH